LQQKPTHLNFVSVGIVKCLDHCEMYEFTRFYVQCHLLRQLSKNHYIWDLVLWVRDVRVQFVLAGFGFSPTSTENGFRFKAKCPLSIQKASQYKRL